MNFLRYLSIIFIFFSISVFGQSYSGPATGNVSSGVQVTTDNFSFAPIGNEVSKEKRNIKLMEYKSDPVYYDGEAATFDDYTYVEDKNAHYSQRIVDIGTSFEVLGFPSIGQTNSVPGDPHMAVGPNHVVTTANSQFSIYDKDGNLLKTIDADNWCNAIVGNPGAFDPQIIYDHYEGRWFMLWDSQNGGDLTGWFIISYSDDEDPLGTWYMYALDATVNGTAEANNWGDYPQLGYDDQGIYISSRQFFFSGSFAYSKIRILNKSELYAANTGPVSWTDLWNIRLLNGQNQDDLHPTISYDPGNNTAYFFWATEQGASFYSLYRITNPITNPVLSAVNMSVPWYYLALDGQQLGSTALIDAGAGGSGMRNAPIIRDGKLYGVHHIRNSQFPANASIKYFVVEIVSNSVIEQVELGAQGFWYLYPAISVDKDHNIAITYSRTAATEYVGSYYSTRLSTDPPGLSESKLMQAGSGSITFNRWGDYLSAGLDPVNQYDIWLYSEYADGNSWGTWVTEMRMKPYEGIYPYVSPAIADLGDVEVNTSSDIYTVIIANYGEDDLIINSIADEVGPFTLESSPSFPVTISTFDTLDVEVIFSPSQAGDYDEVLAVSSNDPSLTGLPLIGHGYDMFEAFTDIFYSSTGAGNNGDILTLDESTGAGTTLGPSLFNEVKRLAVNPINNIIYGIVNTTDGSEIVRVNAGQGDAYKLYSLDLQLLSGIAFNNSGTLYISQQTGEIYTVDLNNGNYTLITTASVFINSIAIDPATSQFWSALFRPVGTGKDTVYTIDLTSGIASAVGVTGFGVMTNDLTFNENDELYGIIGSTNGPGTLIQINTNDGTGTEIGEIGFNNVVGLGYSLNGPVNSVEGDNSILPIEFALKQNYPNPFNPTTRIEYQIADLGSVTLKVYDVLGNEVKTLVNEEKPAGVYEVEFDASTLTSGVYFYQLKSGTMVQTKKMVLLK